MKTHPKFPEYVAVMADLGLDQPARTEVFGSQASAVCFDCPGRECDRGDKLCPITGVWLHVSNLTKLRFAGYDVELDTTEKTMSWKGD
jgi:hypothetical protein